MDLKSRKVIVCLGMSALALVLLLVASRLNTDATSKTPDVLNINLEELDEDIINQINNYVFDNSFSDVASVMGLSLNLLASPNEESWMVDSVSEFEEEQDESYFNHMFVANIDAHLNIRDIPSVEGNIVGRLFVGSGGEVLEKGAEWSKIQSGDVTGYVNNKFIKIGEAAEKLAKEVCKFDVIIEEESAEIKSLAKTDSETLLSPSVGETFEGVSFQDGWVVIQYKENKAYIEEKHVSIKWLFEEAVPYEEILAAYRAEQERLKKEAEEAARKKAEAEAAKRAKIAESRFVETIQTTPFNVTAEEAYLLACLVTVEAGGEPYEGQLAVANVVLNRLRGGAYGNTITDVIYARGQFSVVSSGILARRLEKGPFDISVRATKEALSGVNNVPNYTNFNAVRVANYSSYKEYTVIGKQVFFSR